MDDRVYILLDIVDGKAKEATEVLQGSPSAVAVDTLEGPPDVIVVIEAPNREQLAKLAVEALASVETITEHVCLLPTRDKLNTATFPKLSRRSRTSRKRESSKQLCRCSKANQISLRKGE